MIYYLKHWALALLITGSSLNGFSQSFNGGYGSFFPKTDRHKPSGWFIAPGLTYTLTSPAGPTNHPYAPNEYEFDAKGKLGLYFELGRYKIFDYQYFFNYMDYGLAYKSIAGREDHSIIAGSPIGPLGTGSFSDQHALAFINFNNIIELSNPWFIQNSFGLNVDYQFGQDRQGGLGQGDEFPGRFIAQAHYKFGIGFLASKKLLVIPSVELPIVSGLPNAPWPWLNYFNSSYYPLILSIRFMFLNEQQDVCPPVYNPAGGFTPDGNNPTDMEVK